jgi:hypothetical protein
MAAVLWVMTNLLQIVQLTLHSNGASPEPENGANTFEIMVDAAPFSHPCQILCYMQP